MNQVVAVRPDADILADIEHTLRQYPPLVHDRPFIQIQAAQGMVTISGHTRTTITRRYLLDALGQIPGIIHLETADLFSDEDIRLAVGAIIPPGVSIKVEYGVVILTGRLPQGAVVHQMAAAVKTVAGVREVYPHFADHSSSL